MTQKKRTRRSSKTQFEGIYMREYYVVQALDKYTSSQIKEALSHPERSSMVKHLSNKFYSRNKTLFEATGFSVEDVRSIAAIHSISWLIHQHHDKAVMDNKKLFSNYIKQRLNELRMFVTRKFQVAYKYHDSKHVEEYLNDGIDMRPDKTTALCRMLAIEDCSESHIELLQERLNNITCEASKDKIFKKIATLKSLEDADITNKSASSSQIFGSKRSRTNHVSKLKKELFSNIPKYTEQLCYYSTYKGVDDQMRKKARKYCKLHKIDYIKWAQDKIKNNPEHFDEYIL